MVKTYEELAKEFKKSVEEIEEIIRQCRGKLLAHRIEHRPRPHLDNKVTLSRSLLTVDRDLVEWSCYRCTSENISSTEIN
jgi:uncharacterized protein YyaL (SSP411 family)